MPEARVLAFIHDITVIYPPKSARAIAAIVKFMPWLQVHLALERIQLNSSKCQALLAGVIALKDVPEAQHREPIATQLQVVGPRIRIEGVPIGNETIPTIVCGRGNARELVPPSVTRDVAT